MVREGMERHVKARKVKAWHEQGMENKGMSRQVKARKGNSWKGKEMQCKAWKGR
jgi:hypothetical protein